MADSGHHTMTSFTGILSLSNDLLRDVLDQIEAETGSTSGTIAIDRRAYLSVESFRPPNPPSLSRLQDIGNFRLTCARFADLGAPRQFTQISTRFSHAGFERLGKIASSKNLAKHAKRFSYLIPDFYEDGRDRLEELFARAGTELNTLDLKYFQAKAKAQKEIVQSGKDLQVLREAITAFSALQHVQILRLQTEYDRHLFDYIQDDPDEHLPLVDLKWSLACTHATRTIAKALSNSAASFSRFSGPMMTPDGALTLVGSIPKHVYILAEKLTCLELHFEDDSKVLQDRIIALSPLFRHVFLAAKNLQVLHIGFPSRQPLRIPLETVFHNIKWEKLRAFGVQAWRLNATEIIDLAKRHRKTLRGLRLRDVLLLNGSLWRDVLQTLRDEMESLEWVSLRRIDYSQHFDSMWSGTMEVPDYPPSVSDSDEEDFPNHLDLDDADYASWADHDETGNGHEIDDDDDEDNFSDEDQSNADTDHGPEADDIALSPITPASLPFCTCSREFDGSSALDIGDNGHSVGYQQRKLWEKWVIGKCPEHGAN